MNAEPAEPVDDALNEFGLVALGVGILDTQDHGAALVTGEQPVKQGGARAAYVEIAGGRWRKPHAHRANRVFSVFAHFVESTETSGVLWQKV
jgi:hypothetical protein